MRGQIENQRRGQKELMIEGAREMSKDMLEISKEWEPTLMDGLNENKKWEELKEDM